MPLNFNSEAQYLLENDRVLLRPLQSSDFVHLLPFAVNEPEIWRYSAKSAEGEENLRNYINDALQARQAGTEYPFIVFDKQTNAYAGSTRFYDIQTEAATVQLGYTWYGKNFRGTGLNKHCKFLLLQLAFESLAVERVEFRADARNEVSIAAMKSIGCTVEGTIRNHRLLREGGRGDSIMLSILRDEWLGGVKDKLQAKLINL